MKKLHLVMPMGGGGTRFGNKGFGLPKPLIVLQGKPFFYWAVQSIVKFVDVEDLIFVVLQEHVERFHIDKKIRAFYPEAKIHVIPHVLNGAVLTCLEGLKEIHDNLPVLFNDCDHGFLAESFYDFCRAGDFEQPDGALLTFASDSPAYSYVQFDEAGNVIRTVEKQAVSQEAICGAYYFRNKDLFEHAVESYLERCPYQEFFVSGIYNEMAEMNRKIGTFKTDVHISFGTPEEYDEAGKNMRLKELNG